jgi:hypothetical protein
MNGTTKEIQFTRKEDSKQIIFTLQDGERFTFLKTIPQRLQLWYERAFKIYRNRRQHLSPGRVVFQTNMDTFFQQCKDNRERGFLKNLIEFRYSLFNNHLGKHRYEHHTYSLNHEGQNDHDLYFFVFSAPQHTHIMNGKKLIPANKVFAFATETNYAQVSVVHVIPAADAKSYLCSIDKDGNPTGKKVETFRGGYEQDFDKHVISGIGSDEMLFLEYGKTYRLELVAPVVNLKFPASKRSWSDKHIHPRAFGEMVIGIRRVKVGTTEEAYFTPHSYFNATKK